MKAYRMLWRNNRLLRNARSRLEDNIKIKHIKTGCEEGKCKQKRLTTVTNDVFLY